MKVIPVFPLGTVLFPGMPMPLHIFEPRYLQMIDDCMNSNRLFGVVAIDQGQEALGPLARPKQTGTLALIQKVERNPDGKTLSVLAWGTERFRLLETHNEKPYMTGVIEKIAEIREHESEIRDLANKLKELLVSFVEQRKLKDNSLAHLKSEEDYPADPGILCHFAIQLAMLSVPVKQSLLETDSLTERIQSVIEIIRKRMTASSVNIPAPDAPFDPGLN